MSNLLLKFPLIISFFILLSISTDLDAQARFAFTYNGPDTIAVDEQCGGILFWGHPTNPVFTPLIPGLVAVSITKTISGGYTIGDTIPAGVQVTVTYTVLDNQGGTSIFSFTIDFVDQTPPFFDEDIFPTAIQIQCGQAPEIPAGAITDNCSSEGDIEISFEDDGAFDFCLGNVVNRIWTAVDEAGNQSTFLQEITVLPDLDMPELIIAAVDLDYACDGPDLFQVWEEWIENHGGMVVEDDCPFLTWAVEPATFDPELACEEPVLYTFTAIDGCGNSVSSSAFFALLDTVAPQITTLAQTQIFLCDGSDIHLQLLDWLNDFANAEATDNCTPSDSLRKGYRVFGQDVSIEDIMTSFEVSIENGCQDNILLGGQPYDDVLAFVIIQFVFTDLCGNERVTQASFGVIDQNEPVWVDEPADLIINCTSQEQIEAELLEWINSVGGASASDDCGIVIFESEPSSEDALDEFRIVQAENCGGTGSISIVFKLFDACGNEANQTYEATFSVIDTVAPEIITEPSSLTLDCSPDIYELIDEAIDSRLGAEAEDSCSEAIWTTFSWVDSNGNTGETDFGNYTEYPRPEAADCSWSVDLVFTAVDACGNQAQTGASLSIEDVSPPEFVDFPSDITVSCELIPDPQEPEVQDNCRFNLFISLTEQSDQESDPSNCGYYNYTLTRTWRAEDACGNFDEQTQVINVVDVTGPVIGLAPNRNVECDEDVSVDLDLVRQQISDNCSEDIDISYTEVILPGSCVSNYRIERRWTATDVCGNSSTLIQQLFVRDTRAPEFTEAPQDLEVPCGSESDLQAQFESWLNDLAFSIAVDNCSSATGFAAVPGSYMISNPSSFPGIRPVYSMGSCGGQYFLEIEVDFVYYDECDNASVQKAWFRVLDEEAPEIILCPDTIRISTLDGLCEGNLDLEPLLAFDLCTGEKETLQLSATEGISSPDPGNPDVLVNPIQYLFAVNLAVNQVVLEPVQITVHLNNADAEGTSEFFNIIAGNLGIIGTTERSAVQCGNSTTVIEISAADFYVWIDNQQLAIRLEPNVPIGLPGRFSINDICPGASATVEIQIRTSSDPELIYEWQLDGNPREVLDNSQNINFNLNTGSYQFARFVRDCFGNESSCVQQIEILDTEAPVILCPDDLQLSLTDESCELTLVLEPYTGTLDNCGFPGAYSQQQPSEPAEALLTFLLDPDLNGFLAEDKELVFTGVQNNAEGFPVIFELELMGNIDEDGAYFTIIDEDGNSLGTTEQGQPNVIPGDCENPSQIRFEIAPDDFNRWAADGEVRFRAVSNISFTIPPGGPDSGINPCDIAAVQNDGDNDGTSFLTGTLSYVYAPAAYFVTGATNIDLEFLSGPDIRPEVTLRAGANTVHYVTWDNSGNSGSCSFEVFIEDGEPPVARCQNNIIFINPSGLITYVLDPEEVDAGSTDNCDVLNFVVSPNTFTCNQVGTEVVITLEVTDESGYSSSCTSIVRIENFDLQPTFELDICNPDTLKLFANVPVGPPGNIYTYEWTGPNGFMSSQANPLIANVSQVFSGTYTLRVTGSAGCSAEGSFTVSVPSQLGTPDLLIANPIVCGGDPILLETQQFTGNNVYKWYRGIAPNGVLVGQTSAPGFQLTLPAGNYSFYVEVESPNCVSNPSISRNVRVLQQLTATISDDYIEVCEGVLVRLETPLAGPNISYLWTGPNSFSSAEQSPVVSLSASALQNGIYTLTVFESGCPSIPAQAEIVVKPRPETPIISYNGISCPGQEFLLRVNNIPQGDFYTWIQPDGTRSNTPLNQFFIQSASNSLNGSWSVIITVNGCASDISVPVNVDVEEEYDFLVSNNGPVCESDEVTLLSTIVPGAIYTWFEGNTQIGDQSSLSISSRNGIFRVVMITEASCRYEGITQVEVISRPVITGISTDAEDCMDGTQPVCLVSTVFPLDDGSYTYQWSGPAFGSALSTPCIPNGTSVLNGTYTLVIVNEQGCASIERTVEIQIRDIPATPQIQQQTFYCETDTLRLNVADYGPGTTYFWQTPVGNIVIENNPVLNIANANPLLHSGTYSLSVRRNGCFSSSSEPIIINVTPTPARPQVQAATNICEGDTLYLRSGFYPGAQYFWEGPAGYTGMGIETFIFPAGPDQTGNYFVRTTINGCPSPISEPFFIRVNPIPQVPRTVPIQEAICADLPGATLELCIHPDDQISGATYTWYDALNDQPLGPASSSRCFVFQDLSSLRDGLNEFYVIVTVAGCSSSRSVPLDVRIDRIPSDFADAGADLVACGISSMMLNALAPGIASGVWSSDDTNITFSNPADPRTVATNLRQGENLLIWTISYRSCTNFESDTMKVTYQTAPSAQDDSAIVPLASTININVLSNDFLPFIYTVEIITPPLHGELFPRTNGTYDFQAFPNYVGEDYFEYQVCASGCPNLCSTARVRIQIGDDSDCDVPSIITPNDDGINDVFFIPCLSADLFPSNKVSVFNQWGGVVLEESPYSNNWQGTYKGQDLPVGTYFYIVEFGNGQAPKTGFLMIKR